MKLTDSVRSATSIGNFLIRKVPTYKGATSIFSLFFKILDSPLFMKISHYGDFDDCRSLRSNYSIFYYDNRAFPFNCFIDILLEYQSESRINSRKVDFSGTINQL